jgi:hypothetical protein
MSKKTVTNTFNPEDRTNTKTTTITNDDGSGHSTSVNYKASLTGLFDETISTTKSEWDKPKK